MILDGAFEKARKRATGRVTRGTVPRKGHRKDFQTNTSELTYIKELGSP